MRTARQTSTKETDDLVTELSSPIMWIPGGGVAAAALDRTMVDRLFQAAHHAPILILSGADTEEGARTIVQRVAQECWVKNQSYGYSLGGR